MNLRRDHYGTSHPGEDRLRGTRSWDGNLANLQCEGKRSATERVHDCRYCIESRGELFRFLPYVWRSRACPGRVPARTTRASAGGNESMDFELQRRTGTGQARIAVFRWLYRSLPDSQPCQLARTPGYAGTLARCRTGTRYWRYALQQLGLCGTAAGDAHRPHYGYPDSLQPARARS